MTGSNNKGQEKYKAAAEDAKKRKHLSMLPLEKSLIYKGFELAEVTLQQTLQSLAVAGLVAGHLMDGALAALAGRFAS